MNIRSSRIRRISFLGKKKRRDVKGQYSADSEKVSKEKKTIQLIPEFLEIFENSQNKEKIVLLKNDLNFTLVGKGIFRIVYGYVDVFGYQISSDDDCNDYTFDICENSQLFSCLNRGKLINTESEYEELIKNLNKFISLHNNRNFLQNNLNTIKNFFFTIGKDKISILYIKEISEDFKILKIDKFSDFSSYNNGTKHDFIDCHKFEEYLNYEDKNVFIDNKNFLICGKKNSGKSTFLQFLINRILSYLKNKRGHNTNDQNLFLIDCDSGQPLISSPFTVSLIKINKPLNFNYFNEKYRDDFYEIIASLFVEENTPANKFEDYLQSVKILKEMYEKCGRNNYLVINTNGYTHGLGNIVNSSLVEITKPDLNFYVKNLNSGRLEKGKEFEEFIINEQIENNLDIVMRQFSSLKSITSSKMNLEIKTTIVENNFKLKETKNLEKKNENKSLYLVENLISRKHHETSNKQRYKSISDIINSKLLIQNFLIEIPFDQITFCFNFSQYIPNSELDIFLSINAKLCFALKHNNNIASRNLPKTNITKSNLNLINFDSLPVNERVFEFFVFIYNIDIINRKLIVFSEKFKKIISTKPEKKIILYRNNTAIDKSLTSSQDKEKVLENKIKNKKFSNKILGNVNYNNSTFDFLYSTRNKYSII